MRLALLLGALTVLAVMLAWLLWPSRVNDAVRPEAHTAREGEQLASRPVTMATPTTLARERIAASTGPSRPASARSAGVRGRVVASGAGPIARAAIRLSWVVSPRQETREARCDGEGRFAVEGSRFASWWSSPSPTASRDARSRSRLATESGSKSSSSSRAAGRSSARSATPPVRRSSE